jgi:hypothetical protein
MLLVIGLQLFILIQNIYADEGMWGESHNFIFFNIAEIFVVNFNIF